MTLVQIEQEGTQLLDRDEYNWVFEQGKFRHERGKLLKSFEEIVRDHGPVDILICDYRGESFSSDKTIT